MEKKPSGTAAKILEAAEATFLEKGYDGTSINEIALRADINKSLIYHHFYSKEYLWEAVKKTIQSTQENVKQDADQDLPTDSLRGFLSAYTSKHLQSYEQNPAAAKLLAWQRVDKAHGQKPQEMDLTPYIQALQDKGLARAKLDPQMVSFLIQNTTTALFIESPPFLKGRNKNEIKRKYIEMITDILHRALSNTAKRQTWYVG